MRAAMVRRASMFQLQAFALQHEVSADSCKSFANAQALAPIALSLEAHFHFRFLSLSRGGVEDDDSFELTLTFFGGLTRGLSKEAVADCFLNPAAGSSLTGNPS